MYHLGYISKEAYETHVKKYSEQLITKEPLTPEQVDERQRLEQKDKYFRQVLEQWAIHDDAEWRENILKRAEEWKGQAGVGKAASEPT